LENLSAAIHCTLVMRAILVVPLCLTLVYGPSGVAMERIKAAALLDLERWVSLDRPEER
jgi:hypothetical protein